MTSRLRTLPVIISVGSVFLPHIMQAQNSFRVRPYLQNPSANAMTIIWFSEDDTPAQLTYKPSGATKDSTIQSTPILADVLAYTEWEGSTFFQNDAPLPPYRHCTRLTDLEPATRYTYAVSQGVSHYGHLEIDVTPEGGGIWQATIKPVYIFPVFSDSVTYTGYDRRIYDDIITLTTSGPTSISTDNREYLKTATVLMDAYPNPFNQYSTIRYILPWESKIKLTIHNIYGQHVRTLVNERQSSGLYDVKWDGRNEKGLLVASGIYIYRIKVNYSAIAKKLLLTK